VDEVVRTDVPNGLAIAVSGMTFAYSGGAPALHDLSFRVPHGESVGLIGPNGAGKTTLFLCLAGVLPLVRGMAQVGGLDPADPVQRRKLPALLGIVFQDSDDQLFNATVYDDVAFGPLNLDLPVEEVRARVAESLEKVGLTGFDCRIPHHLSGGEKRRVALAGVLAMQPKVFLLDEPTMFLDPRGRHELARQLNGLPGTRMVATHDLEFVLETCSRALLLDSGRLYADGSVRAILADTALMEKHGLEVPHSLRE
jgi:cobalt/nickel transport system ATP-binding protein